MISPRAVNEISGGLKELRYECHARQTGGGMEGAVFVGTTSIRVLERSKVWTRLNV